MVKENKMIDKRAQHEIFGFVLIIIIVMVVGVFFLMFSLKKPSSSSQTSSELSSLLEASMMYTSDCSVTFIPEYLKLEDLIKECYKFSNKKCLNEKNVCDSLRETFNITIKQTLNVNKDKPNKAFKLNLVDWNNSSVLEIKEGVFDGCKQILGTSYSRYITGAGNLDIYLEVCKAG